MGLSFVICPPTILISFGPNKNNPNEISGDRCTVKSLRNAAKKAGAQHRNAQIRTKDKTKVRVMSLANHDKWAKCTETEWAEELERVAKQGKKPD